MAEQGKPRVGNFTKFFVPGLAIGLAVGGIVGAYFSSRLDAPQIPQPKLKVGSSGPVAHPTGRPEDAPSAPTGPTGPTSETGSEPAPK